MQLTDCFAELFALGGKLRVLLPAEKPGCEELRARFDRLLAQGDALAAAAGFPEKERESARFALCAWLDETVLDSGWEERPLWLRDQLQCAHFGTADAGVLFFQELDALGPDRHALREIYYLCLALGFTGRFCQPDDRHRLQQLKGANLQLMTGNSGFAPPAEGGRLFTEAYTPAKAAGGDKRGQLLPLPAVVCVLAPLALLAILFTVYRFTLDSVTDHLLKTLVN